MHAWFVEQEEKGNTTYTQLCPWIKGKIAAKKQKQQALAKAASGDRIHLFRKIESGKLQVSVVFIEDKPEKPKQASTGISKEERDALRSVDVDKQNNTDKDTTVFTKNGNSVSVDKDLITVNWDDQAYTKRYSSEDAATRVYRKLSANYIAAGRRPDDMLATYEPVVPF